MKSFLMLVIALGFALPVFATELNVTCTGLGAAENEGFKVSVSGKSGQLYLNGKLEAELTLVHVGMNGATRAIVYSYSQRPDNGYGVAITTSRGIVGTKAEVYHSGIVVATSPEAVLTDCK